MMRDTLTFRTKTTTMHVSSVTTAKKALELPWPDNQHPGYLLAVQLVEQAVVGACSPRAALAAFSEAAEAQGLIEPRKTSRAQDILNAFLE